jgi:uncharacterized membrane protein
MNTPARLLGHPIHQQLIVFPLGLLGTSVVFDAIHIATANDTMALVAFWMMVAGVVGGLIAAPFGWIDWFSIPKGARAKSIGLAHGVTNMIVTALFIVSAWLRWHEPTNPEALAQVLSFTAVALALLGGWLGGELVCRLSVGVDDGAHINAPNSLSGRPAHENATGLTAAH